MSWKRFIKNHRLKRLRQRLAQLRRHSPILGLQQQLKRLQSYDNNYYVWLTQHKLQQWQDGLKIPVSEPNTAPLFSIIVPVYNTELAWLKAAVRSVQQQSLGAWQLILCDDASDRAETLAFLQQLETAADPRILILHNAENQGIAASSNRAAQAAQAPFLVFLDHDDRLDPHALATLANTQAKIEADIYYSDEDRLSAEGFRYKHHFKPGFSPSLLENHNYILHLMCIRKTAFIEVGSMRSEFDGSQDYDLLLRLLAANKRFYHIADILYTWGESSTSMVGASADLKPEIFASGQQALRQYWQQQGLAIQQIENQQGHYHTLFTLPPLLRVLLVYQGGDYAPFIPPLPKLAGFEIQTAIDSPLSACLDAAVDVIIVMQAGLYVEDWHSLLNELCAWALRPQVALVSALVLDKNQHIIHTGLSWTGEQWQADFQGQYYPDCELAKRPRDYLAVADLCFASTPAQLKAGQAQQALFTQEDGLLNYCLYAQQHHLRVVYNPYARAVMGAYNPPWQRPKQPANMPDPYLNPHLISAWADQRLPPQLPLEKPACDLPRRPQWCSHIPKMPTSHDKPLFSIILPVFNSNLRYLRYMLESIYQQSFINFEVCISDDNSDNPSLKHYLQQISAYDPRFKLNFAAQRGGIAHNTNRCFEMAKGKYWLFCDHDDYLFANALEKIATYLQAQPDTDLLYSDECMLDEQDQQHSPHYRPDWNPDMFSSQMYFPHLICIHSQLAQQVGKMDAALDGAQDYDFHLRSSEQAQKIGHVTEILYAWRCHPDSVAQDAAAKLYAYEAGKKALKRAMARRGERAEVLHAPETALGVYRIKRAIHACASVYHIVAVESEHSFSALASIEQISQRPVQIIAVLAADKTALNQRLKQAFPQALILSLPAASNRADYYNMGAEHAPESAQLIFSSDEIEIIDSDYPDALLEHSQRPEIGAVGCRILYPNGHYYHTGLLLGVNDFCGYAHRNTWQGPGYWYYALLIRNYTAVSWDLMAVSRQDWQQVGGFDSELSAFADVDFCLKLGKIGRRQVYTPYTRAVIKHKVHDLEILQDPKAKAVLLKRYGEAILNDPQYHPKLSPLWENFAESVSEV